MRDSREKPTLDELAERPERVAELPKGDARDLLGVLPVVMGGLVGRLLVAEVGEAPTKPTSPYLTGDEAAAYLRIKRSRLDGLRRTGQIKAVKLGREYTFRREDLDALRTNFGDVPDRSIGS